MARYWVGGTGTWDTSTTTNWAATSGGASGASVPAATDDVFFDANSGTGTCTVNASIVCNSIQSAGSTLTTLSHGTAFTISIGSSTAGANSTALDFTGFTAYTLGNAATSAITFVSTAVTVQNVNFNGLVSGNVTYNATSGGSWKYTGVHNCGLTATITLTEGTLNVNSQNCTWGKFASGGNATRTITLGSANITLLGSSNAWSSNSATGLTVTANTAVVTFTGTSGSGFQTASVNYNGLSLVFNNTGGGGTNGSVGSAPTLANVTMNGSAAKTNAFTVVGNLTVTGTLTLNGNSVTNRLLVASSIIGTNRTITAGAVSITNADFIDITGAGTANWNLSAITGNSGDCGGNSGITFTTPAQQTWHGTSGGNWSTNAWTSRVPLPQDNVVISSAFTASQTVAADMPRLGKSINWTGTTGGPVWSLSSGGTLGTQTGNALFGSLTLIPIMTLSGSQPCIFAGRSSFTITSAGNSFPASVAIMGVGATYTLQDALSLPVSTTQFLLLNGTFVTNSNAVTSGLMSASASTTLTLGTTIWTLTATAVTTVWSVTNTTTFSGASATISMSTASASTRTFAGAGFTYGTLTYTVTGSAGELDITGSNTFGTINFSDTTARTLRLTSSTTTTITSAFNVHGTLGTLMSISTTTATAATLSANIGTISCKYIEPTDTIVTGGSTWDAINSTDGGGNTGWVFSTAPIVQVYINGLSAWKPVTNVQIQIGGVWKTITKMQVSIGGVWKSVF